MKKFTPNIAIIVIVVVLVTGAVGIYYSKQKTTFPSSALESSTSNDTPTLAANAEYESSNSGDFYYGPPADSSVSATPVPSPAPITGYIYEGAKVVSQSPTKLEMESNANSTTITNWYKEKIRKLNFNAKSFSQTNTNGLVFNKLSAAKPGEKVEITIKKDQNTSNVTITVDRT